MWLGQYFNRVSLGPGSSMCLGFGGKPQVRLPRNSMLVSLIVILHVVCFDPFQEHVTSGCYAEMLGVEKISALHVFMKTLLG